jgi:hypothetical protein
MIKRRQKGLVAMAVVLTVLISVYSIESVYASTVTSFSAKTSKFIYKSNEQIAITVRAIWDTSGLVGLGGIQYTIKIQEISWWGLIRTDLTSQTYKEASYIGKMPNPITIDKTLFFQASKLTKGTHTIIAEISFAKSYIPLFGPVAWDTKTSQQLTLTVQ